MVSEAADGLRGIFTVDPERFSEFTASTPSILNNLVASTLDSTVQITGGYIYMYLFLHLFWYLYLYLCL
jgi:hypothetical protein